jgi:uncharacterized membrane protein
MSMLCTIIGILLGGLLFRGEGAIFGGAIGCLFGGQLDLRQRQASMELELSRLRGLRDEAATATEPPAAPASPPPRRSDDIIDLVEPAEEAHPFRREEPGLHAETPPAPKPPVRQTPPERPVTPPEPSSAAEWLANLCSGENLLVKVGVAILFLGVSFLVKYAAQRGLFPLELRLAAADLGGCTLLAVGWRLRAQRPVYAQAIQGGGVGILYLTTYAAMRLYHLIPVAAGFSLLVAVCALASFLAVAQDSRPMAVLGSAGGFLAPELASVGSGSPVPLFAYYGVLNLGIIAIARYRNWRELHLVGFVGTFIVGALWGGRFYRPDFFFSVEPFLLLFFLSYALLPVLSSRHEPARLDGFVDVGLVFATPLVTLVFQQALVRDFEYGLAWSSLAFGTFYLLLARRLFRSGQLRQRNLAGAFLSLGTLFATLTIPLALDGRWTAAAWSVEGAALVWAGLRHERLLARLAGYLLMLGSGVAFIATMGMTCGPWPILNSFFVGCLLEATAGLVCARLIGRQEPRLPEPEGHMESVLFAWGIVWWYAGGLHEIARHTVTNQQFGMQLLFVAISCLAGELLRRRLQWRLLAVPALGLLPTMGVFVLLQLLGGVAYPSAHGGWYCWPAALAVWYLILYRCEQDGTSLHPAAHAAPLWLVTLLAGWEGSGRILYHLPAMTTWVVCVQGAAPALALLLVSRHGERLAWPVDRHRPAYLGWGGLPLAAAALVWLVLANLTQPGTPRPLPYLPFLNPLDGVTLLVLVSVLAWYRELPPTLPALAAALPVREARIAGGAAAFFWLNAILLRTIRHWCGVPFTFEGLFASLTVQTSVAIFWCLLALGGMTLATRRGIRELWLAGAGLLGAVVVKLFLVDLAGHGSVARIISFVVVGLLILLIGWFSPVPPRSSAGRAS